MSPKVIQRDVSTSLDMTIAHHRQFTTSVITVIPTEVEESLILIFDKASRLRTIERCLDFARHDREHTIGGKKGTGGSPGVPFLKESLFRPIFPDLWAIRHEM